MTTQVLKSTTEFPSEAPKVLISSKDKKYSHSSSRYRRRASRTLHQDCPRHSGEKLRYRKQRGIMDMEKVSGVSSWQRC